MIKKRKLYDLTDKDMKKYYNFFCWWFKWFKITEWWNDNINIDDIKKEYDIFMEKYNQKDWFKSIITYKYLPDEIRDFVNHTMMISINPLFIKKSNLILEKRK